MCKLYTSFRHAQSDSLRGKGKDESFVYVKNVVEHKGTLAPENDTHLENSWSMY